MFFWVWNLRYRGWSCFELQVDDELHFTQTAGPAEWQLQETSSSNSSSSNININVAAGPGEAKDEGLVFAEWKWKRPSQTIRDAARGVYVRERGGVDPQLALHELRQTLLQANRMMAMTKRRPSLALVLRVYSSGLRASGIAPAKP